MRHFQQAEFEVEALFLLVSQLAMGAEHDLQVAGEIFFAEQFGDAGDALAFFAGNLQQGGIFAGNFRDRDIAQEAHHLAGEMRGAVAFADQVGRPGEEFLRCGSRTRPASLVRGCEPGRRRPGCERNRR